MRRSRGNVARAEARVLCQAADQLRGYMEEKKYESAKFALITRDYYDPWEAL
jgi:hypothetical protein